MSNKNQNVVVFVAWPTVPAQQKRQVRKLYNALGPEDSLRLQAMLKAKTREERKEFRRSLKGLTPEQRLERIRQVLDEHSAN